MNEPGALALGLLVGYLLGSIPASFLIAKAFGVDLRTIGSGNVGATNALRALGPKAGVPALVSDVSKGTLAVWFGEWILPAGGHHVMFPLACGMAAVFGHTFSVWLAFKGGKGVATGAGVFGALAPAALGLSFAVFLAVIAATRYVSLASILAALSLNVFIVLTEPYKMAMLLPFSLPLALFIIYKHRDNLRRLMAGTEPKLGRPTPSVDAEVEP